MKLNGKREIHGKLPEENPAWLADVAADRESGNAHGRQRSFLIKWLSCHQPIPTRPRVPACAGESYHMSKRALAVSLLLASLLCSPARADSLQDLQSLVKQGQLTQALEKADQFLAAKPRDAQVRFLKGVVLSELNRGSEAVAVFQKLTEDYPELPEPYNNLAVLYAQQRQYDKRFAPIRATPLPTKTSVTFTPDWPARPTTRPWSWTRPMQQPRTNWR